MDELLIKHGMIFGWLFSLDFGWRFILYFIRPFEGVTISKTIVYDGKPLMYWSGFT
jgi:hypothetical protein